MPKLTMVQVVYNNRRFIEPVFSAMAAQTCKDSCIVAVISGDEDGSRQLIEEKFPQVKIIDPGYNIGFAKGHNVVFANSDSEYFQLVNPDLIMEPDYAEKLLEAFSRGHVGAVTGKLMKYDFNASKKTPYLDSTGVEVKRSGAGRDRGQHEVDQGQYDSLTKVLAVSAAGCMYSKEALEAVKMRKPNGEIEYFDEDFHSYWEDVDLAWRMTNAGYENIYVPKAVAWHGRGTGSHPGGYKKFWSYVEYHRSIPPNIRRLNYKNHIFMYLKNSPKFYWQFFVRELAMLGYVLLFEPGTLKVLPEMMRQWRGMRRKRKIIQRARKAPVAGMASR